MIPRFKPQYDWREWLAAFRLWSKGNVPEYEREFADKFGCRHGVMFAHGRTGIFALLKVWGLSGVEVICPAYTCVVVPNAIVLSGNKPVFVDCAEGAFNMDLKLLEKAMTARTRVVIATHLFGYPMDVVTLKAIVERAERTYGHRIFIIQDCAHSYGAEYEGNLVSSFGDAAIFGSNISKIINSIFGGMVTTSDRELADRLRSWRQREVRDLGWKKELRRLVYFLAVNVAFNEILYDLVNWMERKGLLDRFVKYYDESKIEFPEDWDSSPAEIEARVGRIQIKKYDRLVQARRDQAKEIRRKLGESRLLRLGKYEEGATFSHIVAYVDDRERWLSFYQELGVQLGILIEYSIPEMAAFSSPENEQAPIARRYSEHLINFPVYGNVSRLLSEPI